MSTVGELIDQAEALLKVNQDNIGLIGIESDMSIKFVNKLNAEFFEEFYERSLVAPDYMKKEKGYEAVSHTLSSGAVSAGDTSFAVDDSSSGFESSNGAGVFWDQNTFDIFDYTTNSANTFSTVTGIDFDHADDSRVAPLYKLPTDFGRMRQGMRRRGGVTVNGIPYDEVPENPQTHEFSVYDNGTSKFLWLPEAVTSGDVMVIYDKSPTTLDSTDDSVDIPLVHEDYIVYGLIAKWKRIMERGADVSYEENEQERVVNKAIKKRGAGKRIRAGSAFFNRARPRYRSIVNND